jgi:anti-anti-sigma factor
MHSTEGGTGTGGAGAGLARIERGEDGGVYTITATGEIDISNVGVLRDAAMQVPNRALGLVVDLSRASFIDSATVGLLFELHQSLARRSQALRVVCPPGTPAERVLQMMSFDSDARGEPTVAQAADAIRRQMPLRS